MSDWKHPFNKKTITSRFGETARRTSPHRGTDYAPGQGTLIPAISSGTVKKIAWSDCLGWYMIQSAVADSKTWYVGYMHLSCVKHGINCTGPDKKGCNTPFKNLKVGDKVELGQPVGRVGDTGSCSRGAHLHATLSKTLTGGVTGKVYDLEKFIDEQNAKPQICKCCKRPL
jgi:murein DD-endopeptidase MepM/ murein hydrolase activator NlpD